jgi:hypothetical protein
VIGVVVIGVGARAAMVGGASALAVVTGAGALVLVSLVAVTEHVLPALAGFVV